MLQVCSYDRGGKEIKLNSTIMLIDVSVIFPIKLPSFGDNSAFSDTPNHQLLSYQVVKEGLHISIKTLIPSNSNDIYQIYWYFHYYINYLGVSENVVYPIVPNGFADHYPYEKWLFHWEY